MEKTVACLVVRAKSKRLPLKALRTVALDISVSQFIIQRLKRIPTIDSIYMHFH